MTGSASSRSRIRSSLFSPRNLASTFTQRQVGIHCESFGAALRAALRQLPNVIMVGEIRDMTTAETALQAAESGHLVVSTMHVDTPDQAVQRHLKLIPAERLEAARYAFSRSQGRRGSAFGPSS